MISPPGIAFSCLQCKSIENKDCAVDKPSKVFQVDCGRNSDAIEINSCRKIVQYSNIPGQGKKNELYKIQQYYCFTYNLQHLGLFESAVSLEKGDF